MGKSKKQNAPKLPALTPCPSCGRNTWVSTGRRAWRCEHCGYVKHDQPRVETHGFGWTPGSLMPRLSPC